MPLLIDGYNLLHVTGIFGKGSGPGGFQRSRDALLRFLAASIEEKQRKLTTVVFDATQAPPGLPRTVVHNEMTIRYATGYADADTLIEELIEGFNAPRTLLVVSSDHRIQRAARRRRAAYLDSDQWYHELCQKRKQAHNHQQRQLPEKPQGKLSEPEIDYWLQEFGDLILPAPDKKTAKDPGTKPQSQAPKTQNPFPPGYADDLLEDAQELFENDPEA